MRTFLSARKYPAALAFTSMVILVLGVLLKPRKARPESLVSESETIQLQQIAQRQRLEAMTGFFSAVARDAAESVVFVRELNAAGIVWNAEGRIVSVRVTSQETASARILLPHGDEVSGDLVQSGDLAATLRASNGPALPPVIPVQAAATAANSWVVQVARRPDGSLFSTPGVYRGVNPVTCSETEYQEIDTSLDLTPAMSGGGLFDLDGRLLGLVVRCEDRLIVLRAGDVDAATHPRRRALTRLEREWKIELAPLDDDSRKYFHADSGVLVRGVEAGGIAEEAGVAPGDVVVGVNGEPVDSIDTISILPVPAGAAELTLLRRGRRIAASAQETKSPSPTDKTDIGLRLEEPPVGQEIESVIADSTAGRAGIRAGDRLLEVNGVKVRRREDVDRVLKRATTGPLFMVVRRGHQQVGILLP